IQPGDDFANSIAQRIGSCKALVVLIGDQWLTVMGREGRPRLDDPTDFVRLEIAAALERDIAVIPVLVEGAKMPRSQQLPESLQSLLRRQALEISDSRFDSNSADLIQALERHLKPEAWPARRKGVGLVTALAILLAAALVALLFILARSQPDDPVELSGRWTAEVPDAPGRSFPLVLE